MKIFPGNSILSVATPFVFVSLSRSLIQISTEDTFLDLAIGFILGTLIIVVLWLLYRRRIKVSIPEHHPIAPVHSADDSRRFTMVMLDSKGNVRGWSRAAEETLGYSSKEMIGKNVSQLFTPEDQRSCLPEWLMNRAVASGNGEAEAWRVTKSGSIFWASIHLSAHHDASGKLTGFMEITQKVSRHDHAEDVLKGSGQYVQRILDTSLDMIIAVDKDRRIVEFNKAAQRQFGYSSEEVLGKYVNVLYATPEEGEQFRGAILEQGIAYQKILNKKKSGETFTSIISAGSIFDTNGEVIGVVGVSRTAPSEKKSAEFVLSSEEMYRHLVEEINDAVFSVDRRGVVTYMSPAVERIAGYKPEEIIGHAFVEFIHPDDLPVVKQNFSEGLQNNPQPSEYRVISKSGNLIWLRSFSRPVIENDQVIGLQGVLTDVSDRKVTEGSLQQRLFELQALYTTADAISKCTELHEVYDAALDSILISLMADRGAIQLIDETGVVQFKGWRGLSDNYRRAVEGDLPWKITDNNPYPILVEDARTNPAFSKVHELFISEGLYSMAFFPLIHQRTLLGKLTIYYNQPHKCTNEEVQLAQAIASHVSSAIHFKSTQESLKHRADFESLLSFISTEFINTPASEIDDEINRTLEKIGSFMKVDRSYLFLFNDDNQTSSNTHEWIARGITSQKANLQLVPIDSFSSLTEIIKENRVAHFPSLDMLPESAKLERALLEKQQILSLILVPLTFDNSAVGFIGFDSVKRERQWDEETIRMLRMTSDVLVNALMRKKSEEALHASEGRYRDVIALAPVGYYESARNGLLLNANERLAKILGYGSAEEVIGLNLAKDIYWNPSDRDALFDQHGAKPRITDQELLWKKKDGSPVWVEMNARAVESSPETVHHYEAFIHDITGRKNAERAMRESEERYRSVVSSIAEGIILMNARGEIVACNASAEKILNLSSQQLIGSTSLDRFWPAIHENGNPFPNKDHPPAITLRNGVPCSNIVMGLRKPDGAITWISINTEPLTKQGENRPYAVVTSFHDISDIKSAENSLRKSEELYRDLVENISEYYCIADPKGKMIYASPNVFEISGFPQEDFIGRIYARFIAPEDRRRVLEHYQQFESNGKSDTRSEFRALRNNKPPLWVQQTTRAIRADDGTLLEYRNVIRDITERRQAEATLHNSEERYRFLAENSLDLIGLLSLDGKMMYASPSHNHVLGYQATELIGRNFYTVVQPHYVNVVKEAFHRIIATGSGTQIEIGLCSHEGTIVRVEANLSLFVGSGDVPDKILVTARDITEKSRVVEALQKSEQHYRMLFERNLAAVYRSTLDGTLLDCNESFVRIFGFDSRKDAMAHNMRDIYFSAKERDDFLEQLGADHVIDNREFLRRKKDGSQVWIMEGATLLKDDQGEFTLIEGTLVDITDRKVTYTALEETEGQYRELVQTVQAIVWKVDARTHRFIFVSEEAEPMLGYPIDDWLQDEGFLRSHLHPDDRDRVMETISREESSQGDFELEYRLLSLDGRTIWIRDIARFVHEKDNNMQLVGVMFDITKQKQIEEQLTRSREELRALSGRLESVREEERIRVAREIHDELGQVLTALKMDLSLLGRKAYESGDTIPQSVLMEALRSMKDKLDNTIQSVRKMVTELRPEVLDELGLRAAVEWQAHEFEARTQTSCIVESNLDEVSMEKERATAVFRIFQETLTNIARHARATQVNVRLIDSETNVQLEVMDNGRGINENDRSRPGSLGLVGIRERALLSLGGQLSVHGNANLGTTVVVTIPKYPESTLRRSQSPQHTNSGDVP